jgi:hypothetical protein
VTATRSRLIERVSTLELFLISSSSFKITTGRIQGTFRNTGVKTTA